VNVSIGMVMGCELVYSCSVIPAEAGIQPVLHLNRK
jgi:hypothetical protein